MRRVVYENEPFEASEEERRQLAALLGPRLRWNGFRLRIVGVCGHLNLRDGSCFVIRSRKASNVSLLAWIAYGDSSLSAIHLLKKPRKTAGDEGFGHLIARIFCHETLRVIEQTGLLRAYHREAVRSAVVRGRIDFSTLAREGGNFAKVPCFVFSRLPETPLNRLLSSATDLVHRDPEMRMASNPALTSLRTLLADVRPLITPELLAHPQPLSRIERPFEAAAALARLIVARRGVSEADALPSAGFWIDLATLFENSVARAFRESGLDVDVKRPLSVARVGGERRFISGDLQMEVDVMVRGPRGEELVVDAKYKSDVASANLQQVATYCWLTGARRAALVFPSGMLADRRSFELSAPGGAESIQVDLLELDLGARTMGEWREAGARLVSQLGRD